MKVGLLPITNGCANGDIGTIRGMILLILHEHGWKCFVGMVVENARKPAAIKEEDPKPVYDRPRD